MEEVGKAPSLAYAHTRFDRPCTIHGISAVYLCEDEPGGLGELGWGGGCGIGGDVFDRKSPNSACCMLYRLTDFQLTCKFA